MQYFRFPSNKKQTILALGAESAGNFSVYRPGEIYFSEDFGNLLEGTNFSKFNNALEKFLRKEKIKPEIIITDLHPLYKTTTLGKELAHKFKAKHIQIQHHLAHIFSAIGEKKLSPKTYKLKPNSYGIALDGTGYGLDGNIWGGETFAISNFQFPISKQIKEVRPRIYKLKIERIGKIENQTMIGGDLAVKEPARMLIAILDKIAKHKSQNTNKTQNTKTPKDFIYKHIGKFYTRNQFELLYNQLQSGFNCQKTSSTGRVLDAISILLGFCENQRNYKHEPTILLEQNSTQPYADMKPVVKKNTNPKSRIPNPDSSVTSYELLVTPLFEYLIKNLHRDKKRLAATAQLYIAQGLYEIVKTQSTEHPLRISEASKAQIFLAGGIANNKIIADYLISKGAIANQKIPRGDAGISFGQAVYFILQKIKAR